MSLGTIVILIKQSRCDGWCFLCIGPTLKVQILYDRVDELWLCQHDGAVLLLLHLDAQEITDVTLIIDCEVPGATAQVGEHLIDGLFVWAKHNAVVNIF